MATSAFAQEDEEEDEEQVSLYELSPFQVEETPSSGYLAPSTLTGSRLNTSLKDVASSISVFTEQLLNDTALTDLHEIARYSVGTVNDLNDTNPAPGINNYLGASNTVRRIRMRGIPATQGLNYFQSFIPDDAYRANRYDESRGPNGILFGISEAGGVMNSSTLKADFREDSGRIRYSTGSYSRNRLEARFNKVLVPDVLGITVAGLTEDNGGWRDYWIEQRDRIYVALKYQPTPRLTLQAMGETGDQFETQIRPFNATDRFLPWWLIRETFGLEAVTFAPGFIESGNIPDDDQAVFGVQRTVGWFSQGNIRRRYVYVANDDTFFNSAGTWQSIGPDDGTAASYKTIQSVRTPQDVIDAGPSGLFYSYPVRILNYGERFGFDYPTHLNAGGTDMYRGEEFDTFTLAADYRISDEWYVNIAHNQQDLYVEAQFDGGSRPELRGDPNLPLRHPEVAWAFDNDIYIANPHVGELYFDTAWRYQEHWVDHRETHAATSYDVDFTDSSKAWLGRHRLAAGFAYRETSDQVLFQRYGFLGNPYDFSRSQFDDFDDPRNLIQVRSYITEGDFSTYRIDGPPLDKTTIVTEDGETREIGYIHEDRGTGNAQSDIEVESTILASQNYFWNDHIVFTLGWRRDEARNTAFGHLLDPLYGYTITEDPEADGYRKDNPISADTRTAGVVLHLNDNLSLLANYSTSIGLPGFRDIVYPHVGIGPPHEGKGYDFGLDFNVLDNRITGRLVYYDLESLNRTGSGGGIRIISAPLRDSMVALDEVREFDPTIIRKADGSPYSDAEWAAEIADLNGGVGGGLNPPLVNAFLQDEFSEGWELSLVSNFTDNWRLRLNASYTDRIKLNMGREFEKIAGFLRDENNRLVPAVSYHFDPELGWMPVVDRSKLRKGGLHERILEIAENAQGTLVLEDGSTREITPGSGAVLISTDDSFAEEIAFGSSIADRLWESMYALQVEKIDLHEKRWGLSPYKFNVFTAYDFKAGWLKGFSVGGGYRWLSGAVLGELPDGREFKGASYGNGDLMLKYRYQRKNKDIINYQINIYNVFDKDEPLSHRYSNLDDPTSELSSYHLVDPVTLRATVTYSF